MSILILNLHFDKINALAEVVGMKLRFHQRHTPLLGEKFKKNKILLISYRKTM